MFLLKGRGFVMFSRLAVLALLPLVAFSLVPGRTDPPSMSPAGLAGLMASQDPFDAIVREVTLCGLELRGIDIGLDSSPIDVCLHPDTRPEDAEIILRSLPTYLGIPADGLLGYNLRSRWTTTVMDGATGGQGDPITLTWSIVPDGTWADGGASNLEAVFTARWGGTGWMNKIRAAFAMWEAAIGITYIEVSDDGANMPYSPGSLGFRGDVRIGGRSIDGPGNVLGYDYYPNVGDMVLDTDDVEFYSLPVGNYANLKNVVSHEHGHGMGLGHVIPNSNTKLMEPYVCRPTDFVGPQDDDLRGGMRDYGDHYENNDTNIEPTDLGVISDTLVVENLSIDSGGDVDWFRVTLATPSISIEVDPIGSSYLVGPEDGETVWTATDSISDPDIELYDAAGTTLLASATSGGLGETEILSSVLAHAGDYQIKTFRKAGTGNAVQRYTMTVYSDPLSGIPVADGDLLPETGLSFSVFPNPFESRARMRFYAPSSGPYMVQVFDVAGRLTRTIEGATSAAGWVEIAWDGRDRWGDETASGVYFIRASSGNRVETKRTLRIR
jgi:hypothetical protein